MWKALTAEMLAVQLRALGTFCRPWTGAYNFPKQSICSSCSSPDPKNRLLSPLGWLTARWTARSFSGAKSSWDVISIVLFQMLCTSGGCRSEEGCPQCTRRCPVQWRLCLLLPSSSRPRPGPLCLALSTEKSVVLGPAHCSCLLSVTSPLLSSQRPPGPSAGEGRGLRACLTTPPLHL